MGFFFFFNFWFPMLLKKIFWIWWRKKKWSDSDFLSYNLMLNSGKKIRALCDKENKYSNSCVVRKKFFERNKKPYPPPSLQVKWSVPYWWSRGEIWCWTFLCVNLMEIYFLVSFDLMLFSFCFLFMIFFNSFWGGGVFCVFQLKIKM